MHFTLYDAPVKHNKVIQIELDWQVGLVILKKLVSEDIMKFICCNTAMEVPKKD